MRGKQKHGRGAKHLRRIKGSVSSVKGVSHLSRRAKRRLYCKLQLWMWRKRRERCRYAMFKATRRTCSAGVHTRADQSNAVSSVMRHAGESEDALKSHGGQQQLQEHGRQSQVSLYSAVKDARAPVSRHREIANHRVFSHTAEPTLESGPQGKTPRLKEPTTQGDSQRLKDSGAFGHLRSTPLMREQAAAVSTVEPTMSETVHGDADLHSLRSGIEGWFRKLVLICFSSFEFWVLFFLSLPIIKDLPKWQHI